MIRADDHAARTYDYVVWLPLEAIDRGIAMSLALQTIDDWWKTLSHERRESVIVSVYEDDMATGHIFAEMRRLGLIHPLRRGGLPMPPD